MSLSNFNYVAPVPTAQQEAFVDMFQTMKLGYPPKVLADPTTVNNFSCITLQNHLLKSQVNELQKLVLQYEFTNQKALETLKENMVLRDKAMELELKIGVLTETTSLQKIEIKRRDHSISSLRKDISEHNKRIELISQKCEEDGFEACSICCRNPPVVTICKNHCEGEQIVGCVFCALRKCPLCRNKNIERSFVQKESKKIRKSSRKPAHECKEGSEVSKKAKGGKSRKEIKKTEE